MEHPPTNPPSSPAVAPGDPAPITPEQFKQAIRMLEEYAQALDLLMSEGDINDKESRKSTSAKVAEFVKEDLLKSKKFYIDDPSDTTKKIINEHTPFTTEDIIKAVITSLKNIGIKDDDGREDEESALRLRNEFNEDLLAKRLQINTAPYSQPDTTTPQAPTPVVTTSPAKKEPEPKKKHNYENPLWFLNELSPRDLELLPYFLAYNIPEERTTLMDDASSQEENRQRNFLQKLRNFTPTKKGSLFMLAHGDSHSMCTIIKTTSATVTIDDHTLKTRETLPLPQFIDALLSDFEIPVPNPDKPAVEPTKPTVTTTITPTPAVTTPPAKKEPETTAASSEPPLAKPDKPKGPLPVDRDTKIEQLREEIKRLEEEKAEEKKKLEEEKEKSIARQKAFGLLSGSLFILFKTKPLSVVDASGLEEFNNNYLRNKKLGYLALQENKNNLPLFKEFFTSASLYLRNIEGIPSDSQEFTFAKEIADALYTFSSHLFIKEERIPDSELERFKELKRAIGKKGLQAPPEKKSTFNNPPITEIISILSRDKDKEGKEISHKEKIERIQGWVAKWVDTGEIDIYREKNKNIEVSDDQIDTSAQIIRACSAFLLAMTKNHKRIANQMILESEALRNISILARVLTGKTNDDSNEHDNISYQVENYSKQGDLFIIDKFKKALEEAKIVDENLSGEAANDEVRNITPETMTKDERMAELRRKWNAYVEHLKEEKRKEEEAEQKKPEEQEEIPQEAPKRGFFARKKEAIKKMVSMDSFREKRKQIGKLVGARFEQASNLCGSKARAGVALSLFAVIGAGAGYFFLSGESKEAQNTPEDIFLSQKKIPGSFLEKAYGEEAPKQNTPGSFAFIKDGQVRSDNKDRVGLGRILDGSIKPGESTPVIIEAKE